MQNAQKITFCRLCKSKRLQKVIDLGKTPPANSFLKKPQLHNKEELFPLAVNFCLDCHHLQLTHVVSPEILFRYYVWVSSTSPVTVAHFEEYAEIVFSELQLKKNDLVVEFGSNDGVLLKPFKKLGAQVLGVDPARNVAARATKEGIPTIPEFFNEKIAEKIVKEHGKAKIVTANNCFAHIHDLDEVMRSVNILLDEEGAFVIEAPYNVELIAKNLFDIIYHEHVSYISVTPLYHFFKKWGMEIFDVMTRPVHGGSVRIFVKRKDARFAVKPSVKKFLRLEEEKKLGDVNTFLKFAQKVKANKIVLVGMLTKLKKEGKNIGAYGAPAKATTLLFYFGIGKETIDFIVEDSPYKYGLFTPGKHIPIVPTEEIYKRRPDYMLILAWNFAEAIMKKHKRYREEGGHFIIPIPQPIII